MQDNFSSDREPDRVQDTSNRAEGHYEGVETAATAVNSAARLPQAIITTQLQPDRLLAA